MHQIKYVVHNEWCYNVWQVTVLGDRFVAWLPSPSVFIIGLEWKLRFRYRVVSWQIVTCDFEEDWSVCCKDSKLKSAVKRGETTTNKKPHSHGAFKWYDFYRTVEGYLPWTKPKLLDVREKQDQVTPKPCNS